MGDLQEAKMDRKEYSKSAPSAGRRMSKDKAKKHTTMKEITTWIDKGDNTQAKGSRNVGMLTENVTEQRLLYTRQLELGRERYKFLSSHSYEKQKFVEHQNRKSKSMKKMMQNARRVIETTHSKPTTPRRVITVRIPQVDLVGDISANEAVKTENVEPAPKPDSRPASILAKHEDKQVKQPPKTSDDRKRVQFPKPMSSGKRPEISRRATYIDLSRSQDARKTPDLSRKTPDLARKTPDLARKTPEPTRKTPDVQKRSEKLPFLQKQQNRHLTYDSRNNSATSRKSGRNSALEKSKQEVASLNRSADINRSTNTTPKQEPEDFSKWRLRRKSKIPQYGHKFSSSVGDPRYVALTNTLVPCDDLGKPVISVEDIIAKKEILRGESKCEKNSRAKQLHARFIAYLLEQELRR